MDSQRFDAITRVAASTPDRRNMLKMLGGAAVAGVAGVVALPHAADAALITIVVTDVLNNLSVDVDVKNNNIAVQVCAVVEVLSTKFFDGNLTCEIQQRQ